MDSYVELSMQLRKELEALPRDYTRVMATRNWDVMIDLVLNYNIGRFLVFMDNYYNKIPDKINITKFYVDGPATTAILYYDGTWLTYVVDTTRNDHGEFYTYYGYDITVNNRYLDYNERIIDYNLLELDGTEIQIIGIWAGLMPEKRW